MNACRNKYLPYVLMWIVKVDSITQYSNYNTLIFEIILLVESLKH